LAAVVRKAGRSVEPLVLPLLAKVLAATGDKDKKVMHAAEDCAKAICEVVCAWATVSVMPTLIEGMGGKAKPAQKEICLKLVTFLAEKAPQPTGRCLVSLVPAVSDLMWDIKKEVKAAAIEAMEAVTKCTGNRDLDPFIPVVLAAIQKPDTVPESVEALAGCVFVQNVCAPALAVTTPVLVRGLNDRSEPVKRKCCVIIDNMCKLVEEPKEVLPLMPKLQPLLEKNMDSISDPEARKVAERAYKTLTKAGGEGEFAELQGEDGLKVFKKVMEKAVSKMPEDAGFAATLAFVSQLAANLTNASCFEPEQWAESITALLSKSIPMPEAEAVCAAVLEQLAVAGAGEEEEEDDEPGDVTLYKGVFSLAYGSLTLLNNTRLHLKRNKFYGLLGPNNCGKTTLMRAIANEQVEGFPKRDELKTIFVEHEIQEREVGEDEAGWAILNTDLKGIDWVVDTCNHVYEMETPVTREQVEEVMEEIGFGNSAKDTGKDRAADANMPMTTYSGGWKMKMQLCAATLMNADILMLDEPTGHLDVKNIAWIQEWLQAFMEKGGSVIATSHDTSFLNNMCTHIIDFQDRKLRMFRGEKGTVLNTWVEKFPEKKGYFELKNDVVKFVFPKPGALDGVKSKTKAIMKMSGVYFTYPTRDSPTVMDIGLQVSQASRVAVIGPNGAGKSTAIKLLNGELKASEGTIWKHPNMRLAYVAQHAFQHLEKHMTKSPVQYILDRFAGNEDKESLEFKDEAGISQEDETLQDVQWFLDPKQSLRLRKCETKEDVKLAVVPETLMKRRENKKEKCKEYEVKWQFKAIDNTNWIARDLLVKMGYIKMVQRKDEQEAAAAGLMTKPLTSQSVEKHLMDFGIEVEQASHTLIQALSGGQKVKVVLAASMWQNPHLVILDEPTNYLDRDGLGALTKAIEDYEGGVIIISHNREFANAVSQEKWIMEAGRLRREGESIAKEEEGNGNAAPDEVKDAFGNTIKIQLSKNQSDKEKKAELKKIDKQLKDHAKKKYLSEEEMWELQDRKEELKNEMAKTK
jgi:elongation factor 3